MVTAWAGLTLVVAFWQLRHTFVWQNLGGGFFEYGSLSIYIGDVGALILLVLFGIGRGDWRVDLDRRKMLIPVGILLGWMALTSLWSIEPTVGWYWVGKYILWLVVGLVVLPKIFSATKAGAWLLSGVTLSALVGIGQNIRNASLGIGWLGETILNPREQGISVVVVDGIRKLRAYGLTTHPNILGGLVAWIVGWVVGSTKRWSWFGALGLVVALGGLVLSFARGGWIALVGVLVVATLWGMVHKTRLVGRRVLFLAVIFGLLLVWQSGAVWGRVDVSTFDNLEQRSINDRLVTYSQWWSGLSYQDLLVGVGQGNYVYKLAEMSPNLDWWELQPVHSAYLLWLAQLGVVGTLLAGWVAWLVWVRLRYQGVWLRALPLLGLGIMGIVDHWTVSLHQGVVATSLALALIFWEEDI